MRWKIFAIVVLLAVAGAAIAASLGLLNPASGSSTSFLTANAEITDVVDEVAATGTLEAAETEAVSFGAAPWIVDTDAAAPTLPGVAWPVKTVDISIGDIVSAGDVLATANDADLEAQIADATRSQESAQLQVTQAEDDLDDADSGAPTRRAQIALYSAQSSLAHAESALAALVSQRDYTSLTAPIDGIVTAVAIRAGSDAPAGAAITIASRAMVVRTSVVESDLATIELNQSASVDIGAVDAEIAGTVSSIAPTADDAASGGVVTYVVTVELAELPDGARPGMTADVTIVTASANSVLAVPSRALAGSGGSYTVRVVGADGTVETRAVEVGLVTASLAEITSGLLAGEAVVTGTSSSDTLGSGNANGNGPGGGFIGGPAPGGGFTGR